MGNGGVLCAVNLLRKVLAFSVKGLDCEKIGEDTTIQR